MGSLQQVSRNSLRHILASLLFWFSGKMSFLSLLVASVVVAVVSGQVPPPSMQGMPGNTALPPPDATNPNLRQWFQSPPGAPQNPPMFGAPQPIYGAPLMGGGNSMGNLLLPLLLLLGGNGGGLGGDMLLPIILLSGGLGGGQQGSMKELLPIILIMQNIKEQQNGGKAKSAQEILAESNEIYARMNSGDGRY